MLTQFPTQSLRTLACTTIGPVICLVICLAFLSARPASGNSFRTPEYWRSRGLESIGAAKAYALGFTGKGVVVGYVDGSAARESGEFADKYPLGIFRVNGTKNDYHGTHVSGVIAAAKNDQGMHGVAFNASLLPVVLEPPSDKGWVFMKNVPEATIINNSWAYIYHLDSTYLPDFWDSILWNFADEIERAKVMVRKDKLIIMAAGNEGHLAPTFMAGMPTLLDRMGQKHTLANNWLNVAAYNPAYSPSHPAFIWTSSNLGLGASAYTLLAPGVGIYSTTGPKRYEVMSGTSMAAPHVAGVAALVKQAFPYMGGKQLADVLLSTATPLKGSRQPRYIVLLRETYNEDSKRTKREIIAYSTGGISATRDEKNALLAQIVPYTPWDDITVAALLVQALAFPTLLSQQEYDSLFGQGTVNAARAVRGPGHFDAARLDPGRDLHSYAGIGNYALYPVNTLGYDSIWSNDIGERRALSGRLAGLGVGLLKDGAGVLHLTGDNSYSGPTDIRGGSISLGAAWKNTPGSLAGHVYVREQGLFTGAGRVGGDLYSSGVLVPGFAHSPGSVLSVAGHVRTMGRLHFVLGRNGQGNRLHAGSADLRGAALSVGPATGRVITPYTDYNNVLRTDRGISGLAGLPPTIRYSPFLIFRPESANGRTLSLTAATRNLDSLPGQPRETRRVATALQSMHDKNQGTNRRHRLDYLYNLQRSSFESHVATLRGDLHAATLNSLPFNGLLRQLAQPTERPHQREPGELSFHLASGTAEAHSLSGPSGEESRINPANPASRDNRASQGSPASQGSQGSPAGLTAWMRPLAAYSSTDGRGGIYQDKTVSRVRGLAVGLQGERDGLLGGVLVAVGDGTVEQGKDQADIIDTRVGLYAAAHTGALRFSGLLSAGWQFYDTARVITHPRGRDHVTSHFTGYSLGLGLEASCNLLHEKSDSLALSPLVGFDLDYVRQQSREESGSKNFALDIDGDGHWRTSLQPGLRLDFSPAPWLNLHAGAGYRRLLNGSRPSLDAGFRSDSTHRFQAIGKDEGRNFATYSFGAEASLPRNVTLAARFFGENSSRTQSCAGYATMLWEW